MRWSGHPGVKNAPQGVLAHALASHTKGAERCQRCRLFTGVPGELPGGGLRPPPACSVWRCLNEGPPWRTQSTLGPTQSTLGPTRGALGRTQSTLGRPGRPLRAKRARGPARPSRKATAPAKTPVLSLAPVRPRHPCSLWVDPCHSGHSPRALGRTQSTLGPTQSTLGRPGRRSIMAPP